MGSRDNNPVHLTCRGLQNGWIEAAKNASAVHSLCANQLQRLLISSGMVNQHLDSSSAHFHRRKPAFASVSIENNSSSSKRRKRDDEQQEAPEERMSKRERKKRNLQPAQAAIDKMSPEERQEWYNFAKTKKFLSKKVEFQGKKTTIGKLVKEIQQEEQQQAGGEVNYTGKGKGAALDKVPGWELRPGAPKMQLRPDEEARLPLDLMGRGTLWSKRPLVGYAFGGVRDVGFGIYARCDQIRSSLQERWAGRDPEKVLANDDFYDDILSNGSQTELTLMAVPSRNISLPTLRKHVEKHMMDNLKSLSQDQVDPEDAKYLHSLCSTIDGKFLKKTGFVKGDNILAGTNFIFSTTGNGQFAAEAITPTKELKDRRMVPLWLCKNPRLTRAFFSMVLGPNAVCSNAKVNIGQGALYVTNGFKFGPNPENSDQVLMGPNDEEPDSPYPLPLNFQDVQKQHATGAFPEAFSFAEDPRETMWVLSSKRHSKREWKLQRSRDGHEATEVAT